MALQYTRHQNHPDATLGQPYRIYAEHINELQQGIEGLDSGIISAPFVTLRSGLTGEQDGGLYVNRGAGLGKGAMYFSAAQDRWVGGIVGASIVPFAMNDGTIQTNLNSDMLDGYHAEAFPRKAENATITGSWTHDNTLRVKGATTLDATLAVSGAATLQSTLAVAGNTTLSGNVGVGKAPSTYAVDVSGSIAISGSADFGIVHRQQVNLNGTAYGAGTQAETLYHRSARRFAWYQGGVHSDGEAAPGTGGTILLNLAPDVHGGAVFYTRIEGPGFISGITGSGWRRTTEGDDELRSLTVRGRMRIYELLLSRISVTNGSRFATGGMTVDALSQSGLAANQYRVYAEPGQLVPFLQNDLVQGRRWDMSTGSQVVTYGRVSQVAPDASSAVVDLGASSDAPLVGMTLARYGSTSDSSRQGGIYETTDDTYAPYIDVWDGLTNVEDYANIGGGGRLKVRLGRQDGLGSITLLPGTRNQFIVTPTGYGITTTNGIFAGKIAAQEGRIASWTLAEDRLSATFNGRSVILGEVATNVSYGFQAKGVDGEVNVVSYTNVGAVMYWYRNASNEVMIGDDYRGVLAGAGVRMRRGGTDVFKFDDNGLYVNGNGVFTGEIRASTGYIGTEAEGWGISSRGIANNQIRIYARNAQNFEPGGTTASLTMGNWQTNDPIIRLRGANGSVVQQYIHSVHGAYLQAQSADGTTNVYAGSINQHFTGRHGFLIRRGSTNLFYAHEAGAGIGPWTIDANRLAGAFAGRSIDLGLMSTNPNYFGVHLSHSSGQVGLYHSTLSGGKTYFQWYKDESNLILIGEDLRGVIPTPGMYIRVGGVDRLKADASGLVISGNITGSTITGTVTISGGTITNPNGDFSLASGGLTLGESTEFGSAARKIRWGSNGMVLFGGSNSGTIYGNPSGAGTLLLRAASLELFAIGDIYMETGGELRVEQLPTVAPAALNRVWRDASGYLRIT